MKSWDVYAINRIYKLNLRQARYREDGKWYHRLEHFPAAYFDAFGFLKFDTESDYLEYSRRGFIQIVQDVHAQPDGISGLPGYRMLNPAPRTLKPW